MANRLHCALQGKNKGVAERRNWAVSPVARGMCIQRQQMVLYKGHVD